VVRHVQPSSSPSLPTIAGELLRMIAEVPNGQKGAIAGGDLLVHTDDRLQLVRLRVEKGGALHVRWAHPDYAGAERREWTRGAHALVESRVQRLNGRAAIEARDPRRAVRDIEKLADTFEGLYPEGACLVSMTGLRVEVKLDDVNLDAELLVDLLLRLATPGTLDGTIEVSSFASEAPEHDARFVMEAGRVWIQRPVLWDSEN
jgi:hypothetical protein